MSQFCNFFFKYQRSANTVIYIENMHGNTAQLQSKKKKIGENDKFGYAGYAL
jgi:hypothetical protein